MKFDHLLNSSIAAVILASALLVAPLPRTPRTTSQRTPRVFVSTAVAPPAIPDYAQPSPPATATSGPPATGPRPATATTGSTAPGCSALRRRALDPRLLGLGRWRLPLVPRLLGPHRRLLRRHQLRLRLLRHRLLRRLLARRPLLLQPRLQPLSASFHGFVYNHAVRRLFTDVPAEHPSPAPAKPGSALMPAQANGGV